MIRFLFKQNQPRRFNYKPRYYDADKEALQRRIRLIEAEVRAEKGKDDEDMLRSRISEAWRSKSRTKANEGANKRVLVIAAILAILAYFLLYS